MTAKKTRNEEKTKFLTTLYQFQTVSQLYLYTDIQNTFNSK